MTDSDTDMEATQSPPPKKKTKHATRGSPQRGRQKHRSKSQESNNLLSSPESQASNMVSTSTRANQAADEARRDLEETEAKKREAEADVRALEAKQRVLKTVGVGKKHKHLHKQFDDAIGSLIKNDAFRKFAVVATDAKTQELAGFVFDKLEVGNHFKPNDTDLPKQKTDFIYAWGQFCVKRLCDTRSNVNNAIRNECFKHMDDSTDNAMPAITEMEKASTRNFACYPFEWSLTHIIVLNRTDFGPCRRRE